CRPAPADGSAGKLADPAVQHLARCRAEHQPALNLAAAVSGLPVPALFCAQPAVPRTTGPGAAIAGTGTGVCPAQPLRLRPLPFLPTSQHGLLQRLDRQRLRINEFDTTL